MPRQLKNLYPITLAAFAVWFSSCGADIFGSDSREIAGGYRLKHAGGANQFALAIPHEGGGLIIDEIGWHQPIIIARAAGSEYWEVINTARAEHTRLSDRQRKADPLYQSIEIRPVETAWNDLKKRLW